MKTLPSIPKSIPANILKETKSKGLVYVGVGNESTPIFPTRVDAFVWEAGRDDLMEEYVRGNLSSWHYFVTPEVAAKYFTLPKKTPAYTRGAKGRFVKKVTYPDVKNVESRPLGLAHSITNCDLVLNGDREALLRAFTWETAAPTGEDFSYWQNRKYGYHPMSPADLDFIRAVRDEFKARLALKEKVKAEAAAKAKREEEEKKARLPKIGEVWHDGFTSGDYLVAQVGYGKSLMISLRDGNRLDDSTVECEKNILRHFGNYGPFTFVASNLEEYFKAKLKA